MDIAADLLVEFFELAISNILFNRHIYPDGIFIKRKKYGIPVQTIIHPELNEYIINCLKSMKPYIVKDEIHALVIAFFCKMDEIKERFVIEIGNIKTADGHCKHNLSVFEEMFRAFCLKIAINSASLKPLPEGCHFRIFIHTRERKSLDVPPISDPNKEMVWIQADKTLSMIKNPNITPIRSANNSLIQMQLFVETKI